MKSSSSCYETTFIVAGKTPQETVEAIVEKVKKIISKPPSQIGIIENEGLKKLAYPIKGSTEGHYIYCEYTTSASPPFVVTELENFLRINDSVIRYLTVLKAKPPKVKPRMQRPEKKRAETTPPQEDVAEKPATEAAS